MTDRDYQRLLNNYRNDVVFNRLVDSIQQALNETALTLHDVRDAVDFLEYQKIISCVHDK